MKVFDFRFIYSRNDAKEKCNYMWVCDVTKVSIQTAEGFKEISEDDISNSYIPFQTLYLCTIKGEHIIVSVKNVSAIEIIES